MNGIPAGCRIAATAVFLLASLIAAPASAQALAVTANPPKPRVYALIAAVGEQFTIMFQKQSVGSHFAPYERSSIKVEKNVLNRYVLHSLDKAIAQTDPDSKRIYMTLRATDMDGVPPSERESVALAEIVADLKGMPEREQWDRVIVATPAYKAFELNGIGGRLEGFGVFYQPMSGGVFKGLNIDDFTGEDTVTPDNKPVRSNRYAAPFSFIEILVIDPRTLEVLDRQKRFDNVKVFDPMSDSVGISQNVASEVLMNNLSSLVERSVSAAVAHSEILSRRGVVNVGDLREVTPEEGKK